MRADMQWKKYGEEKVNNELINILKIHKMGILRRRNTYKMNNLQIQLCKRGDLIHVCRT